jgi:hypothetical protein
MTNMINLFQSQTSGSSLLPILFGLGIAIATSHSCEAQTTYGNFKIEDGELIYQQVFDTTVFQEDAHKYYLAIAKAKNVQLLDEYLTAEFENEDIDVRKYGRTIGMSPMLFGFDNFSGKIKIDFKEDKYRLTIFALKTVAKSPYGTSGDLSASALKKNRTVIRPSWASTDMLGLIQEFIIDTFSIRAKAQTKEW